MYFISLLVTISYPILTVVHYLFSDAASAAAAASSSTSSSTNAAAAANYLSAASTTADYSKGLSSANPVGVQGTTGQILDLTRPIRSVWILVENAGTKLQRD